MSTFEPNDGFDELLRSSMHDEADTVMPAGDGLSRIQQRVSTRRARLRWLRPTMALGSAAAVAVVAVGAYTVVHDSGTDTVKPAPPATQLPTDTQTPDVSPSPTPPAPAMAFPKRAIFPFVSAKDERAFEQQAASGTNPWKEPAAVATAWVTNFLQLSTVNQVVRTLSTPTKVDVVMGRTQTDGGSSRQIAVTTVHLVKFGKVWIVTGATDGSRFLRIASPLAGSRVTSPLVVSGPGGGADRAAYVQVRDATTPTSYGEGHTGSFGVQGWSADASFNQPSNPVGVLLVVEKSSADGLPLRVTAEQVRFGASSVSAGPQYFYGIKNGRVTKFAASSGAATDYLTDPQPGGGASDPQLVGHDVYFIRAGGTCVSGLHKVSTAAADNTQPEVEVTSPDDGYVITGFAIDPTSTQRYSYYEQACDSSTSPQAKLVFVDTVDGTNTTKRAISFESQPPLIDADPSYEPPGDAQLLDAIVQTGGSSSYIARYDTHNTTSPTPSRRACPGYDGTNGRPWALETDAGGTLWFATQTGSSMQVVKCAAGGQTAVVAFTVPGNRQPKDVDVSSDGSVLLTDLDGHIWRWDGSGEAQQLSPNQPVTDVTW